LFIFSSSFFTPSNAQIIETYAGNGYAGYSGNGGQATVAEINLPSGVAVDNALNLYISDNGNDRVRIVNTSGIISTFAGNGASGYFGDGGQATAAELNGIHGMAVDASGNIYVADGSNNRIREINASGIISTFAGNGIASFSGDGGQATAAELKTPTEITFDATGNAYIADDANNRIRKVNTSGVISTFAGNGVAGFSGDAGQATAAELHSPVDVYVDAASGNTFIVDNSNNRIRKVTSGGVISTFAGNGTVSYSGDGGQATAAELNSPSGVRVDG
jgi:putative salt-induced outer membrane protein YdiY